VSAGTKSLIAGGGGAGLNMGAFCTPPRPGYGGGGFSDRAGPFSGNAGSFSNCVGGFSENLSGFSNSVGGFSARSVGPCSSVAVDGSGSE